MNDYDGDVLDHRDNGNEPITDVLSRLKRLGTDDKEDDLKSVAERLPRSDRFTAFWDKNRNGRMDGIEEFSMIDHLLVPRELYKRIDWVSIPKTHDPRYFSDHFAVVVSFDLKQRKLAFNAYLDLIGFEMDEAPLTADELKYYVAGIINSYIDAACDEMKTYPNTPGVLTFIELVKEISESLEIINEDVVALRTETDRLDCDIYLGDPNQIFHL